MGVIGSLLSWLVGMVTAIFCISYIAQWNEKKHIINCGNPIWLVGDVGMYIVCLSLVIFL